MDLNKPMPRALRMLVLLTTLFALLFSTLAPMIELHSATRASGLVQSHTVHHYTGGSHYKLIKAFPLLLLGMLCALYSLRCFICRVPRHRLASSWAIPLLLKRRLLRPLKFTASFVVLPSV